MAETKTINLDIETNLGSLKSQLREAQAEVASMADKFGVTSQQAAEAAKKAAELKDRIADAKDLTDAFNPDAKFNALSRSIGGALDGFQAFEGAMGLVGVESEELQKTLLKVQSAMALSQGIQGVMEAKDSFVQLGAVVKNAFTGMTTAAKVFMVSGVGILIAALGVLIAKWDDVKTALTPATAQAKKFEQTTRESAEAARAALDSFDEYEKTLRRLGFTEDQIASKRRQRFKEAIEQTKRELKAAQDLYNSQKENLKTVEIFDSLGLNATGRALFGDEEEAKAQRKRVAQLRQDIAKIKNDEYEFNQQQKQAKEEAKKQAEEERKAANDRAKEAAEKRKEELAKLAEYNRAATDLFKSEYEKQKRDIEEKYALQIALAKKYHQSTIDLEKAKNKELEDLAAQQVDLTREGLDKVDRLQINSIKKTKEFQELEKKGLVGVAESKQRLYEIEKSIDDKKQKAQEDALSATAGTLGQLSNLLGEQTKAGKAAAIAEATIQTFLSAQKAYSSTIGIPVVGPVLAPINAGLAIAAGIKNIQAITAVKTPSGGGGGNSSVQNSFSGNLQTQAPSFNVVGNSGVNQLAQLQQTPVQAYVVSGNVTTAQSLDRNRIENATL